MSLKENSRKSREQKFIEFYESLQVEYIVAELRYNIYPEGFRKEKSLEIMKGKKERIFQIATKNRFKCIFKEFEIAGKSMFDSEMKERLYCKVFPKFSQPNFYYRDHVQKKQLGQYDEDCYYHIGSVFEIPYIGKGILKNKNSEKVFIDSNGSVLEVCKNECQRVFNFIE